MGDPSLAVERVIGTALLRLTGVFVLGVAATAVLAPRQPAFPYARARVLVCLVLAAGLLALALHVARRLGGRVSGSVAWTAGVVTALVGGAGCTVLALALRYDVGWDARMVATISNQIAHGQGLDANQYVYLSRYPNNLPLVAIDNLCQDIGSATHLAPAVVFVLLNGLALAVTLLGTHWLVSMLRGPVYGVMAQLLVLGLVGLSPWMTVPYTDVVVLPFVVLAPALVIAGTRTTSRPRQALFAVLTVACLLLGYIIKTTPVVSLVAIVLIAALVWISAGTGNRILIAAGVIAGLVLFLNGSVAVKEAAPRLAGVSAERLDRSLTPPTVWWIYMGTVERVMDGRIAYGGYDRQIVEATAGMNAEEAKRWAQTQLDEHLADLGPLGYARFLADKAAWNWGDGMFWAWSEGYDATQPGLAHGSLADFVNTWNRPDGGAYTWRAAAAQAVWLLLLLVTGIRLLRARWRWEIGLLTLCVLGIAAFTLIFQGRSRYLLAYVPIIVALAVSLPPVLASWRDLSRLLRRHDDPQGRGDVDHGVSELDLVGTSRDDARAPGIG